MTRIQSPNEIERLSAGAWSFRRSAAFITAAGIVFWAIVLTLFFGARIF